MMLLELQSYLSVSHIPAVTHTVPPRAADTPMSLLTCLPYSSPPYSAIQHAHPLATRPVYTNYPPIDNHSHETIHMVRQTHDFDNDSVTKPRLLPPP